MSGLKDTDGLDQVNTGLYWHVGLDGGPGLSNDTGGAVVGHALAWGTENLFWGTEQLIWGL